jgi:peptidoglycan/xylan/chitin deacetylase (PgdA/CDA1 family)
MRSRFRGVPAWLLVDAAFKLAGLAFFLVGHAAGPSLVLAFADAPLMLHQLLAPGGWMFGRAVTSFATDRREVWLTIDDGPSPASTPQLLELLDRHAARATFFLIGQNLARHPDLARALVERGHAVGNHSFSHPSLTFWCAGPGRLAGEIDRVTDEFGRAGVAAARWFRPPVGLRNPWLAGALRRRNLELILWSARGFDGTGTDARAAFARIARRIRPGAILLAHEAGRNPAHRLEFATLLLEHLTREGYRCVIPPPDTLRTAGPFRRPATSP